MRQLIWIRPWVLPGVLLFSALAVYVGGDGRAAVLLALFGLALAFIRLVVPGKEMLEPSRQLLIYFALLAGISAAASIFFMGLATRDFGDRSRGSVNAVLDLLMAAALGFFTWLGAIAFLRLRRRNEPRPPVSRKA